MNKLRSFGLINELKSRAATRTMSSSDLVDIAALLTEAIVGSRPCSVGVDNAEYMSAMADCTSVGDSVDAWNAFLEQHDGFDDAADNDRDQVDYERACERADMAKGS